MLGDTHDKVRPLPGDAASRSASAHTGTHQRWRRVAPCCRGLLKDDVVRQAIVNGTDAPKGRYRYIASLRSSFDGWMHFCGGTWRGVLPRLAMLPAGHGCGVPASIN